MAARTRLTMIMAVLPCYSPSLARGAGGGSIAPDQPQLSRNRPGPGLEAPPQERREALQQQFVVVGRGHLREELERVGARERIGKRAHHEVQAPRELLAREVRQRLEERFLVAPDHPDVLRREEMADERRGIGVRAADEAEEILA